ncbi:MAG: fatty acid desaturase [Bryobacteraceae bacterium]|jgi:stearoyl-CoA desaturase (delta-9 desaturase)
MDTIVLPFANRDGINWTAVTAFAIFHVEAVAAFFFFSWPAFFTALALYWVSLSLGIGMGYHRLLTHRSYKTAKCIEYFLAVCGSLAMEGGPISWVTTHRIRHATNCTPDQYEHYSPDLSNYRFLVWLSKYFYLPLVLVSIVPLAWGGLPFLLWGLFLRVTIRLHTTWLVNSLTRFCGSRRFATRDDSRNNWFVALLTFGEGWHNNHHAYPSSARHGLAWYEIDMSWLGIRFLQLVGLAKSVNSASL